MDNKQEEAIPMSPTTFTNYFNEQKVLACDLIKFINSALKDCAQSLKTNMINTNSPINHSNDYITIPLDVYVDYATMDTICALYVEAGWGCVAYRSYRVSTKTGDNNTLTTHYTLLTDMVFAQNISKKILKEINNFINSEDTIERDKFTHSREETNND